MCLPCFDLNETDGLATAAATSRAESTKASQIDTPRGPGSLVNFPSSAGVTILDYERFAGKNFTKKSFSKA